MIKRYLMNNIRWKFESRFVAIVWKWNEINTLNIQIIKRIAVNGHVINCVQLFKHEDTSTELRLFLLEIPCFYIQIVLIYLCGICTMCVRYIYAMRSSFTLYMFGSHCICSVGVQCMFYACSALNLLSFGFNPSWAKKRRTGAEWK